MTVPPDQPYPSQGQPYPPNPSQGQPYPPAGQPYPAAGAPYPPAGQPYPAAGAPYPPAGQPYPAAGAPYPPAGQPYPPAPGQPVPAPGNGKKNFFQSVVGRVVIVLVVVAIGIGATLWFRSDNVLNADVGDCFSITGKVDAPVEKKVECSDDSANLMVTETDATSMFNCDEGELYLSLTNGSGESTGKTVCMRPNVEAGECFDDAPADDGIPTIVPCSTEGSMVYKYTEVLTGTVDPSGCSEDSQPWILTKRQVVYCVTTP